MSLGAEVWFGAMLAGEGFEDGSFFIEDTSLEVNGGSTVDLRVRLGAKPRSDVTVALSETSDLISLSPASLTFTPDNWDVFQDVTVTAGGNRQDIPLPANVFTAGPISANWSWVGRELVRPRVVSALQADDPTYFAGFDARNDGSISLNFSSTVSGGGDQRRDLSEEFENSGSIAVTAEGNSLFISMAGQDTTDAYQFTPSDSGQSSSVTALANAYGTDDNFSIAGALTLRDYVPADVLISLSASGPAEYAGITGSATVTVN